MRCQKEGETAEQYITSLYSLVDTCVYGTLRDQMLRDRLVVGIRDMALSEKLQTIHDLTLEKAKQAIRQKEAVHEQQQDLQAAGDRKPAAVDRVQHQKKKPKGKGQPPTHRGGAGSHKISRPCMRCGKARHPTLDDCPALQATCYKCKRKGHCGSVCLSKTGKQLQKSKAVLRKKSSWML